MKTEREEFQKFCNDNGYMASSLNKYIFHAGWQAALKSDEAEKSALQKFNMFGGWTESDPLERLRFFCSQAMNGQDWLDVEQFFDAVSASSPDNRNRPEPTAPRPLGESDTVLRPDQQKVDSVLDARGPMPEPVGYVYSDLTGENATKNAAINPSIPNGASLYSAEQIQAVMDERDRVCTELRKAERYDAKVIDRLTAERDAVARGSGVAHQRVVDALEQVGDERNAMRAVVEVARRCGLWGVGEALAAIDALRKEQQR